MYMGGTMNVMDSILKFRVTAFNNAHKMAHSCDRNNQSCRIGHTFPIWQLRRHTFRPRVVEDSFLFFLVTGTRFLCTIHYRETGSAIGTVSD